MDTQDDPYDLLGVSRDASVSQIRSAYRKAALQHHPDRVASEDKATANLLFAKISNAYEILSDDRKRAEFDQQQGMGGNANEFNNNFHSAGFSHPHASHFDAHFNHHFRFHDPFEVFRHVFQEEFGGMPPQQAPGVFGGHQHPMSPFMNDPFFSDPFGRGMAPPSHGSLFGGGGGPGNMFDSVFDSMHSSIHNDLNAARTNAPGGSNYSVFSSSSTTSFGGGAHGESVSTQTTRRIVNGQEETVTERIVRKADGTVERQVLHQDGNINNSKRLEQQQQQQQHQLENGTENEPSHGIAPWRRRSSKSKRQATR